MKRKYIWLLKKNPTVENALKVITWIPIGKSVHIVKRNKEPSRANAEDILAKVAVDIS